MNGFKKKIASGLKFFVTFLLVFSLSMTGVVWINKTSYALTGVTLTAGNVNGAVGAEVSVPITISDPTNMISLKILVDYDNSALELVGEQTGNSDCPVAVPNNGIFSDWDLTTSQSMTKIPYNLIFDDSLGMHAKTGSGTVIALNFKIKSDAVPDIYDIKISAPSGDCFDKNLDNIDVIPKNGSVTVTTGSIDPPPTPVQEPPTSNDIAIDYSGETLKTATGLNLEFSDNQAGFTWTSLTAHGVSITDHIGKTIYIRKHGETALLSINVPARPIAPINFELESTTETSVTFKEIPKGEYKIDGGDWTSDRTFSGLEKDKLYTFYARYKATNNSFASNAKQDKFASNKKIFSGTVAISGVPEYGKALTASASGTPSDAGEIKYQWFINGEKIPSANADLYFISESDVGNQLHVEVRASSDTYIGSVASAAVTIKKGTPEAVVFPKAKTLNQGDKLKDAKWEVKGTGDGTFAFKADENTVPPVGTNDYTVVFTPTKSNVYNNVEREVSVTVKSSGSSSGGGSSSSGGGGRAVYIPSNETMTTPAAPVTTPTVPAATSATPSKTPTLPPVNELDEIEPSSNGGNHIDNQIKNTLKSNNPSVTLDDETGTVISRENLLAIKKSGKTVKFVLSDDIYITIAAADISDSPRGIDLDINCRAVAASVFITDSVKTAEKSLVITPLAHGDFGFTETIHISQNIFGKLGVDSANVYYISDNGAVSDFGKATINNGGVSFKISHASAYAVSKSSPVNVSGNNVAGTGSPSGGNSSSGGNSANSGRQPNPDTGVVNTGVGMYVQFILAISLSLMIACLVCRPKKCLAIVTENFIVSKIKEQLWAEED